MNFTYYLQKTIFIHTKSLTILLSQIIHWELSEGANQWIIWGYPDLEKSLFWCSASKPEKLIFLNRIALEIFLMQ